LQGVFVSKNPEPADIDIAYLHEHATCEITPETEEVFIELVGKNVSDGMSDKEARDRAFQCIFHR
jgi:hypothetical protein